MTRNLVQLLARQADHRPGLTLGTVDNQITLRDALRRAADGAFRLYEKGLRPGDRVAIVATSSTDYLVVWMACLLAGTPVALINPTYPPELLEQMLGNFDPRAVLTDLDPADLGTGTGRRIIAMDETADWVTGSPADCPGMTAAADSIASFMHTSGTTGVPKFCAQTHEYFLRLGRSMADRLDLTPADRMLAPLPLFHINPMGYGIIGALSAGADALTVTKFSARGFWPTVREHHVTALVLHAPPVEILKRATTADDASGHEIRTMFYADSEFMSRFGIERAVSGYGSTEAAGVSHLHTWALGDDIPANASRFGGLPRPDIEDLIDEGGQILVREREPNTLFAGYFSNGELHPSVDDDGWFATGDLGRRDDRGRLVFIERAAESIRVNGEFVPIPYVEDQLAKIDALTDFALWKKPGDLVDDEVVLYVVADSVPVDEICAVSAGLPPFMRPTRVAQVGTIPRDAAAGKAQRRLLHDQEVTSWITLR